MNSLQITAAIECLNETGISAGIYPQGKGRDQGPICIVYK